MDTWEYDGNTWKLCETNGPPRTDYGLTFDSTRGVCVAFGHYFNDEQCAATWEWDGVSWKPVSANPFDGASNAAYFEPLSQTVFVTVHSNDFAIQWNWNGDRFASQSTNVTAIGPMVYDSKRKTIVMITFGSPAKRLWEFDGTEWSLRPDTPPPIAGSIAYDSKRGVTVLFGKTDTDESQTWEWDGNSWLQRFPATTPSPRSNHGMAFDTFRGVTVLHGGHFGEPLRDTWEWDGINWTLRAESHIPGNKMNFNPIRNRVIRLAPVGSRYSGLFEWTGDDWIVSPDNVDGQMIDYDEYNLHFDPIRNVYGIYGSTFGKLYELRSVQASPGDITCDGAVNVADLLMVINAWGPCPAPAQAGGCPADIAPAGPPMGDGVVNVLDLLMVVENWK